MNTPTLSPTDSNPAASAATEPSPVTSPQPAANDAQSPDSWTAQEFGKVYGRYKNDPQEVTKALWNQQKELTRLQQELAQLRKSGTNASQTAPSDQSTASPQSSKQSKDGQASTSPATQANEKSSEKAKPSEPDAQASGHEPAADALAVGVGAKQAIDSAYLEIFESGKVSEATGKSLQTLGFDAADAALLSEALSEVVSKRMREAQKTVETDIKSLKAFAEQEGVYTDKELSVIQEALNMGQYGILRDVERKYKASQSVGVQHGAVASGLGDGYDTPQAYYKDRNHSKYLLDPEFRATVDAKYGRSNSDDWQKKLLGWA